MRWAEPPPVLGARWIPIREDVFALVDADVYDELIVFLWQLGGGSGEMYPVRRTGKTTFEFLHRRIIGAGKGEAVDHRDRNPLNCRKSNLRIATTSQNLQNRCKPAHGVTSKFKGVCRPSGKTRWRVAVGRECVGWFDSEIDAAEAYDRVARERYGEFAVLNFPEQLSLFA